ncbi:Hypothetical protein A7982_07219 [Minicystis rosea]|nr:Hypothetical protein A7982_07219 [Minicystis rosea]
MRQVTHDLAYGRSEGTPRRPRLRATAARGDVGGTTVGRRDRPRRF